MTDNGTVRKRKDSPYLDVPGFPEGDLSLEEITGRSGPYELEIGFGKGHFAVGRAQTQPRTTLLGIETRRKWVGLVAQRAAKRGIKNVIVRFGDARQVIRRIVPDGCLERVFVNFPDPWWKAKHAKRMVVTEDLGGDLIRLLKPGGELFVQTDVDFRAEAYAESLCKVASLEPKGDGGIVDANPFGAKSLREIQCEKLGLPIYRLLFSRI